MSRPVVRALLALLALACAPLGLAQVCQEELASSVEGGQLDRPATGLDAALLMHAAVSLVEPALPSMMVPNVSLPEDHPDRAAVRQVASWGLLPNT
ncbi:MAG TPA: hypothetical protein VF164_06815, partial [Trueperaceae bacterium]